MRAQADDRMLAELQAQADEEQAAAEHAEAELARSKLRSRQKREEIEEAKAQLRRLAEELDPSDERREAFEQYMAAREGREHATLELHAHSAVLEEKQAKLEAARQRPKDGSAEPEESPVGQNTRWLPGLPGAHLNVNQIPLTATRARRSAGRNPCSTTGEAASCQATARSAAQNQTTETVAERTFAGRWA